ncbi:hypothetical protein [Devosia sp. CAU 1758]
MQALYDAILKGGTGMSRTQLMRLARPTIEALRGTRSSWSWIAARIERVRSRGIEEPIPHEDEVDAAWAGQSLGPVRSAYARIVREEHKDSKESRVREQMMPLPLGKYGSSEILRDRMPAIRAGPQRAPDMPNGTGALPVVVPHGARETTETYFDKLKKLKKSST